MTFAHVTNWLFLALWN